MVKERNPKTLQQALALLAAEDLTPYAGGTDLMVRPAKNADYLFLSKVAELCDIYEAGDRVHMGACVTYTQAIESPIIPEYFKVCLREVAAPAIRNMGTIGGNIANGSAKADSVPTLYAVDAMVSLASLEGDRCVPLRDLSVGKANIEKGELLKEIIFPQKAPDFFLSEKVGEREALAISRVSIAGAMNVSEGVITSFCVVFGAVSKTVLSWPELDAAFVGKTLTQARAIKADYKSSVESAMQLIDGRVSAGYRKFTCLNLLESFFEKCGI